ncbi:MAG: hypothetical protein KF745_12910 [Phycisphaeraceae bacterium]|nr:hypothetical protein [Phycisphaeraceae bacterium]
MARPLRTTAICLLLGAITTVLVAWSCLWWPRVNMYDFGYEGWPIDLGPNWPPAPGSTSGFVEIGHCGEFAASSPEYSGLAIVFCDTWGFPFPCLSMGRCIDSRSLEVGGEFGQWQLAPANSHWLAIPYLPVRPKWPALAFNTAFYAALFASIWMGPSAIRRTLRSRRGQCLSCGYTIGTADACTECGSPVLHPRARRAPSA